MPPQVELVCGEGRGEQFEDGQRDAAGVDLLEHLAYRLARGIPFEFDNRELIRCRTAGLPRWKEFQSLICSLS